MHTYKHTYIHDHTCMHTCIHQSASCWLLGCQVYGLIGKTSPITYQVLKKQPKVAQIRYGSNTDSKNHRLNTGLWLIYSYYIHTMPHIRHLLIRWCAFCVQRTLQMMRPKDNGHFHAFWSQARLPVSESSLATYSVITVRFGSVRFQFPVRSARFDSQAVIE